MKALLAGGACAAAGLTTGCIENPDPTENIATAIIYGFAGNSGADRVYMEHFYDPKPSANPVLNGVVTGSATQSLPAPQPAPQTQVPAPRTTVAPQDLAYLLDNEHQQIFILDAVAQSVTGTIALTNSTFSPGVIALAPNGQNLVVGTHDLGQNARLLVVSIASGKILATIPLSSSFGYPTGVAITPDGRYAYVTANLESVPGVVWVADIVNYNLVTAISIPASTLSAAMSPDGSAVYVATTPTTFDRQTFSDQEMTVIDTLTNTAAVQINFPSGFYGLDKVVISPNGRHVYATSNGPNVAVIDAVTNTFSTLIKVAPEVTGKTRMALTPDGHYLYTIDQGDLFVNLIDVWQGTLVSRTAVTTPASASGQWVLFELVLVPAS